MKLSIIPLFLVLFTGILLADNNFGPGTEPVHPGVVDPMTLPDMSILSRQYHEVPKGQSPDPKEVLKAKNSVLPVGNGTDIYNVENQQDAPIYIWNTGYGPNQNGLVPADVDIATGAGGSYQVIVSNQQYHIYTSAGLVTSNTFSSFFGSIGVQPLMYDPKIIYDVWSQRWVMIVLGLNPPNNTESWIYVAASQTNNPTGSWWIWKLNGRLDGGTNTNNWTDLPGLGFSYPIGGTGNSGSVVIGMNQYNVSGSFQYPKLRILKTSQLYTGASITWYDLWNFTDAGGQTAFTPQPARQLFNSTNANMYVVTTKSGGGNVINYRVINNPTAATPTLSTPTSVGVTAYVVPPDAPTLGGSGLLDAGDCRTQNTWYLNGHVYTAWNSAYNWGTGNNGIIHYARINVTNGTLAREVRVGAPNIWFMYPAAAPEFKTPFTNGFAGIGFTISSSSIYPAFAVIGDDGAAISSYFTVPGTGYLGGGTQRLGDYSGICPSDQQNGAFVASGMLANSGSWGTGTFRFAFTAPPLGNEYNSNELPEQFLLYQNFPNPFNPTTSITYGLPVSGSVRLAVYDILGKEISVLVDEYKNAGRHSVQFNADGLPSGIYFYRLITNGYTETKKMTLTK